MLENITVVCSMVSSAVLGRSSEGMCAHFDLNSMLPLKFRDRILKEIREY